MKNTDIIDIAIAFLNVQGIEYKEPITLCKLSDNEMEVIFKHVLYDDPDCIICPDEYRVIVNINSRVAQWGLQM